MAEIDEIRARAQDCELGTTLDALRYDLRENHRMKWVTDYAITHKYGQYRLLTNSNFAPMITEVAEIHGIVFAGVYTYS